MAGARIQQGELRVGGDGSYSLLDSVDNDSC